MKRVQRILTSLLLVVQITTGFSQNNDCNTATPICTNGQIVFNPDGIGLIDDLNNSIVAGCITEAEQNSAWYYFEMNSSTPPNTELGFIINPDAAFGEDYDFALYGPNVDCNNLGAPLRCSWADEFCAFCPLTGLGNNTVDVSEDSDGDGFVSTIFVNPGEGYYLMVDNYNGSGSGFSMDWTEAGAQYLDCSIVCDLELTIDPIPTICGTAGQEDINLNISTSLPDYNIEWTASANAITWFDNINIEDPSLNIPANFLGTETLEVIVSSIDGSCIITEELIIAVLEQPILNELDSVKLDCDNINGAVLGGTIIANPAFDYTWTEGGIVVGTSSSVPALSPGDYILTVSNGDCEVYDTAWVTGASGIASVDFTNLSDICTEDDLGIIEFTINGGQEPIALELDGNDIPFSTSITNLSQGMHQLLLMDANNCEFLIDFTIDDYLPTQINIGDDLTVDQGVILDFLLNTNLADNQIISTVWSFNNQSICQNCSEVSFTAINSGLLSVTLTNSNGCVFTAELFLTVDEPETMVYIPNVFTPNSDGINDFFTAYYGEGIDAFLELHVFDRWGAIVYSSKDEVAITTGWDGSVNGRKLNPAVFTYHAVFRKTNQENLNLTGSITLVR